MHCLAINCLAIHCGNTLLSNRLLGNTLLGNILISEIAWQYCLVIYCLAIHCLAIHCMVIHCLAIHYNIMPDRFYWSVLAKTLPHLLQNKLKGSHWCLLGSYIVISSGGYKWLSYFMEQVSLSICIWRWNKRTHPTASHPQPKASIPPHGGGCPVDKWREGLVNVIPAGTKWGRGTTIMMGNHNRGQPQ